MNGLFNSVTSNDQITAQDFLDVYNYTNKIFADSYLTADPLQASTLKSNYRYGWGNNKTSYPENIITAYDWNQIITRCNLIISHTGLSNNLIDRVPRKMQISYQKLTDIQNVLNSAIANVPTNIQSNLPRYNYISPSLRNVSYVRNVVRSDSWYSLINTTLQYEHSHYNDIRYFFNSGSAYEYILSSANECGPGMFAIADILEDIGTLIFDITNFRDSKGTGVSANKNYFDLNKDTWTLLWTSNAGFASSYSGSSGYSGYSGYCSGSGYSSSRIKVFGRLSALYESVLIRFDYYSTVATVVEGVLEIDLYIANKTDTKRYGIQDHQTIPNINITDNL